MVNPILAGAVVGGLVGALLSERKIPKSEWVAMFDRWTGPSSNTEESRIRNTEAAVKRAVAEAFGVYKNNIKFIPQGSSINNTNVKNRSDLDLVVVAETEVWHSSNSTGQHVSGFVPEGTPLDQIYPDFRQAIYSALSAYDLLMTTEDGNKAIKLSPTSEARVKCDVLPAFRLRKSLETSNKLVAPRTVDGVIFLSGEGHPVQSFPEQHLSNGKYKNVNTGYRYKQLVRIFKKLRDRFDANSTLLTATDLPSSYQIESLLYNVHDDLLVEGELYDAVLASASWIKQALSSSSRCNRLVQVHGVYALFSRWSDSLLGSLTKPEDIETCDAFISRILNEVGP